VVVAKKMRAKEKREKEAENGFLVNPYNNAPLLEEKKRERETK